MTIYPIHDPASQAERMRYPAWCSLLLLSLQKQMLRSLVQLMLLIFSLLAYGQASAACNLSFSTTVGGQVTQSGSEYKYTFSATDYANCDPGGKTDGTGSSLGIYVDAIGNQNSAGNKTFSSSSAHGTNNVYIMSIGGSTGPTNIDAFYYTPPNGYSGPDSFVFYDFNGSPYTVNVTVVAPVPGAPTGVTATPGSGQASVAFTAPASDGGSAILDYTVTSSPGGFTATGAGSPLTVTGLTNGTSYTFRVTARNANGSGTASSASTAVTPKATQTITFNPPGAQTFGTTPTLTATASSGLTPTFTSTTTGVCTITSGGALTFVTAGSCTINADQAGNTTYSAAATVPQTFTVNAIAPGAPTAAVGTAGDTQVSVAFTAPASNGGSAILDYTVTASPGGATATGAASPLNVTGLTNGTAYTFTVTARNSAGSGSASTASSAVTPKAPQTITFNPPGAQTFGTTPTLTATASSGLTPTFTSTTTGVCTITSGGALTFVTAGSCTINADQAGNAAFSAAATVPQTFTVNAIVPGAPTAAVGTPGDTQVSVAFTAPASNGGSAILDYTVTASPGGATATGAASPLNVTGLTNGTAYTFTVTARNSAGSGSASTASSAVTPKAAQTITFNPPGAQTFGTTPTLTATASSTLPVTFTSTTTGVCTVTSGGALTFVTAGSCTINADQAGNGTYLAATTVGRTFAVNATVPGAPTGAVGTAGGGQVSVAFTAPAYNGGSAITGYTVTASPGGANVSGATSPLVVTGLTNGTPYTFTVTATNLAGTGAASTASTAVTPKAAQTITFNPPGGQAFGTTPTLSATASSGLIPTFTSSTTGVCTITSGGALTFVTTGTCIINADQAGDGTYGVATTISRTFAVNPVVPGAPTGAVGTAGAAQVSVAFTAPVFNGGSAITGYTVTASPGGASVSGATSPLVVTGLTNGTPYTFTVTATNLAGTGAASTASTAVTPKAPQTITFGNPGTQTLGTALTLTASASSGLTVTFTSSTPGVCSVTPGGVVSSISAGVCTINVNQAGNTNFAAAATATQSFTISPLPVGVLTFAKPGAALVTMGSSFTNVATSTLSGGGFGAISYSSSNNAVATVNAAGVVTPVSPGSSTITATQAAVPGVNDQATQTYTLTVAPLPVGILSFTTPNAATVVMGGTLTNPATSTLTGGSYGAISYSSSNTAVATVSASGVITPVTAGSTVITATQAAVAGINGQATQTYTLTVAPLPVGILSFTTPNAATVMMGNTLTNFATSTLTGGSYGGISYSSSNTAVATVSATGVVTPVSVGNTVITAIQSAVAGINGQATQTYTLTVAPLSVGILSFTTPNAATVVMGGTLTNPATSTLTGGSYGAISYSSSNTAVATVSANGAITTVSAGTSTITATQAAVAGVNAQATQTYVLTVGKNAQATLRVVSDKSSIFKVTGTATLTTTGGSGTGAISTAVTTGTCSVAGNVVTAGSVAETCVVTVTKAADANYSAATATVSIQILSMATSSVTLASSSLNPMLGQSVNLTATVNPSAATGTASFMDGTTLIAKVNLSAGAASLTTSTLAVGSHNLTVVYSGDANLASSTSGAIVVNVNARPDPVSNPLVKQNIVSQATTTQRFTVAQMTNIYNHVQILHSDFNIRNRFGAGLNVPYLDTLRLVGGKILDNFSGTQEKDVLAGEFGTVKTAENQRRARAPFAQDGTAHQKEKRIAKDEEADQEPVISDDVPRIAGMPAGFWTAGNIDVGSLDAQDGSRTKFSSAGLTLGMDVMVNSKLIAGGSLGYAKDNATFDNLGSESKAKQWSGSLYATYKPEKHWFVDGVLGAGHVTYDNRRWDSNNNVLLSGDRKGKIIYGSLSLTRELILQQFRVHPFGRVDVINVKLDSYSEQGSPMALTFKDSSFTNSTVTGGVDIFKDYFFASGQVTPSLKLQLSHRTSGDINQSVYYSDTGVNGPTYNAIVTGIPEDVQSLGLGLNFKNRRGFQANFAWLGSMGANAYRANSFRLDLRFGF